MDYLEVEFTEDSPSETDDSDEDVNGEEEQELEDSSANKDEE